jgi:signal peptidase I
VKSPLQFAYDAHALKCELAGEVLRSSGKLRLRVTGCSMLPAVWPGDTLFVERTTRESVEEGDIVLYERDRRFFVHRVVRKTRADADSSILTRGDAMPQPDPPVSSRDLLGRVSFIVRDGRRIEPRKRLRLPQRALAALVRRSETAAGLLVRARSMLQTSLNQNANDRAVPCQN